MGGAAEEWIDHVLGEFTREERPVIEEAIQRAADAVELLLREGPGGCRQPLQPPRHAAAPEASE